MEKKFDFFLGGGGGGVEDFVFRSVEVYLYAYEGVCFYCGRKIRLCNYTDVLPPVH